MTTKLTQKAIDNLRDMAKLAEKVGDDRIALYAAGQTDGMREALKLVAEKGGDRADPAPADRSA